MALSNIVLESGASAHGAWLETLALASRSLVVVLAVYHTVLVPAGLRVRRPPPGTGLYHAFAILIPAHNEATVIGNLLDNLEQLDYPRDAYDVFVVADNCTDATVAAATRPGVHVVERRDPARRGKPYAVEYGLAHLNSLPRPYDAVVILDADNLVARDFLRAMNARLGAGELVIQGYLDTKNPDDTWVSACFALSYWVSNRFWCLAKHNLGLAVPLGGTGMCIATEALRQVGWGTATLTEDLEFTVRALLRGIKTTWAHEAVVYDEKPLTLVQSWRQRVRWVRGTVQVARRYLAAVLAEGIRRRDPVLLEAAFMLCRPVVVAVAALAAALLVVAGLAEGSAPTATPGRPGPAFVVLAVLPYLLPLVVTGLDRVPLRPYRFLPLLPLFAYTWIPVTCQGVLTAGRRRWVHTVHTRAISHRDLFRRRLGDYAAPVTGPE